MSFAAHIENLRPHLRDLIKRYTDDGATDFGVSEKDKAEVADWLNKVATGFTGKPDDLKSLDAALTSRTYIVSNYLTVADIALYGSLHPIYAQLQPDQYLSTPALTRYFDHIQTQAAVRKAADTLAPEFASVSLDFSSPPPVTRPVLEAKKKEKKDKDVAPSDAKVAASKSKTEGPGAPKKEKKEKSAAPEGTAGKGKEKVSKSSAAPAEDAGEPVPSMIDLRVGHILEVKKHPDADGLYVEQIDFGEESGPRTVVSGLVNYIPIEKMQDKWLIGVCNLKPANMRGVKSFAMVLCATSKDGKEHGIEIVDPPPNSKPGDRVYFEGGEFEGKQPLPQLNPKKKIFETIQPGFTTLDSREAAWVDPATKSVHKIRTSLGVCTAPTFVGASLS